MTLPAVTPLSLSPCPALRVTDWLSGSGQLYVTQVSMRMRFDRGALPLFGPGGWGSTQAEWGVEIVPVILSVASIVGGAGGAEAVGGRAAHVGAAGGKLLLLKLLLLLGWEAGRGDALAWRRDGLGFNVDIMAGVDGEIWALR